MATYYIYIYCDLKDFTFSLMRRYDKVHVVTSEDESCLLG